MRKTVRYRLYAAKLGRETIREAIENPLSRISGGYALIYKQGKAPEGYREVIGEAVGLLTETDREWLKDANMAIMLKFAKEHTEARRKGIRDFAARFERELEAEREKMEETDHG